MIIFLKENQEKKAGKEGQCSNLFIKDLDKITDFIDRHRPDINALSKDPDLQGGG